MEKAHPQPGEAPPAYSQTAYNTPASYGVQTAPPPAGSVPPPGSYPPSPPGSYPPPPPPGVAPSGVVVTAPGVVITSTPGIVGIQPRRIFNKFPTNIVCQHCNTNVVTQPRAEVGCTTWAASGILILFGCWLGCCLIPFCIDDCKDIYHDCPNCKNTIDIYKHM